MRRPGWRPGAQVLPCSRDDTEVGDAAPGFISQPEAHARTLSCEAALEGGYDGYCCCVDPIEPQPVMINPGATAEFMVTDAGWVTVEPEDNDCPRLSWEACGDPSGCRRWIQGEPGMRRYSVAVGYDPDCPDCGCDPPDEVCENTGKPWFLLEHVEDALEATVPIDGDVLEFRLGEGIEP